jgi:rSAM/selenodomain-associated transferase 1
MTSSARRTDPVHIAVFAKAPVPGAVKTRLAAMLGEDGAAGLHSGLVRQALSAATEARVGPVELWCTPDETHPFFERCAHEFGVTLERQRGDDLGQRMRHAFDASHARDRALILIGADCPALDAAALQAAARSLREHDVVIAPAEDGGYVLVGLARPAPDLFEAIPWGGSAVMAQTRLRLAQSGASWVELPTLWDVDRPEDYARLQQSGLLREVLS